MGVLVFEVKKSPSKVKVVLARNQHFPQDYKIFVKFSLCPSLLTCKVALLLIASKWDAITESKDQLPTSLICSCSKGTRQPHYSANELSN